MKLSWPKTFRDTVLKLISFIFATIGSKFDIIFSLLIWLAIILAIFYFATGKRFNPFKFVWDIASRQNPSASSSPSPSPSEEPHADLLRIANTQKVIVDAINSKRFSDISPYLEDKVELTILTEDCCDKMKPEEVIKKLTTLAPNVPFDFAQNSPFMQNLKIKNSNLAEEFIGESETKAREQLVAFNINGAGKITKIQIAVSWKLYNF